ncbi:hypothetical protein [Clostridium sp. LP20]|uniref:hypothetical protein n=1 Tax=Clostridium sp. LP20 TaxID=3418665 RepID=UPI003EE70B18
MGILSTEVNYNSLLNNLGKCCLTTDSCKTCKGKACLIGYSKACVTSCIKDSVTYVMDGQKNIPMADGKLYDSHDLIDGIADLLKQCKNCDKDHFDNCLINVMRNCYEVLLLGDIQEYKGSSLLYLSAIKDVDSEISGEIMSRL